MRGIKLHMLKPMERHIVHQNGQVADNSLLYVSITNVAATVAAIDAATLYYYYSLSLSFVEGLLLCCLGESSNKGLL